MFNDKNDTFSFFQDENQIERDETLEISSFPILKNIFSSVNKAEYFDIFNYNLLFPKPSGLIFNIEKTNTLPEFYPIDKIIDDYIKNTDLKKKLNEEKSIINMIHYKFIELGHKRGNKTFLYKEKTNYAEKHIKRGRKTKTQNINFTHTKMSPDNIIKKIKCHLFNKVILDFLNKMIKLKFENIKLFKLDYKYINKIKRLRDLQYLKMKLKDLFSLNTTKKMSPFEPDYNKMKIEEIIDKDDTIKFVLNLTCSNFIDLFIHRKKIEEIEYDFNIKSDNINYEEIEENIPSFEEFCYEILRKNDAKCTNFVIFILFNFERALKLKQKRVKKIIYKITKY